MLIISKGIKGGKHDQLISNSCWTKTTQTCKKYDVFSHSAHPQPLLIHTPFVLHSHNEPDKIQYWTNIIFKREGNWWQKK